MKVLEIKQVIDSPILLSWSPKADLLAIVYETGQTTIHRLNWERLWKIDNFKEGIPNCITWHPEGRYLCLILKTTVCILDAENGRILWKYMVNQDMVWAKWCSTEYEANVLETIGEFDKPIQPLESNLSILFLATSNGQISVYIRGLVLAFQFSIPSTIISSSSSLNLLSGDSNLNAKYFEFISYPQSQQAEETSEKPNNQGQGTTKIFYTRFESTLLPTHINSIGQIACQSILLKHCWSQVQEKLQAFNDQWKKIYTAVEQYMYFENTASGDGQGSSLLDLRADYFELVLSGNSIPEIDQMLSKNVGQKISKKNIGIITIADKNIKELVSSLKSILFRCLYHSELVGEFIQRFGPAPNNKKLIIQQTGGGVEELLELSENIEYIFYFIYQVFIKIQIFIDGFVKFLEFFAYKSRAFNSELSAGTSTSPEDVNKILTFLETKGDKDLYEFFRLLQCANANSTSTSSEEEQQQQQRKFDSSFAKSNIREMLASLGDKGQPAKIIKKQLLGETTEEILRKIGNLEPNFTEEIFTKTSGMLKLNEFQDVPTSLSIVAKKIKELHKLPLVDPKLTSNQYLLTELDSNGNGERDGGGGDDGSYGEKILACSLRISSLTGKTTIFLQTTPSKMYLYELTTTTATCEGDGGVKGKNTLQLLRSTAVHFTSPIITSSFYSDQFITLIGCKDRQQQTAIYQLATSSMLSQCKENVILEQASVFPQFNPQRIEILVPTIEPTPIDLLPNEFIGQTLKVDCTCPSLVAINGGRKLGALLNNARRIIMLVDFNEGDDDDEEGDEDEEMPEDVDD